MKKKTLTRRIGKYNWFLGFLGFKGFEYFYNHEVFVLFWFCNFSFFAFYFINKMDSEMEDERFLENSEKAKLKIASIPLVAIFLIGFFAGFPAVTKELITIVCAFVYSATIISYAVLFWYYDTH